MSERGEEMASSLPVPDHLLAEILLRLPTAADLVRASAVFGRSFPTGRSFVRRFCKLHAPPLLGFINLYGNLDSMDETRFSHPAAAPHPSASAAGAFALAADLSFSFLPGSGLFWAIRDILDGRVLLDKSFRLKQMSFKQMVVCDPLHRMYLLLPPVPSDVPTGGHRFVEAFLAPPPAADDEETSFRVIWMAHSEAKVSSFVFSSASGQWRAGPFLTRSNFFAGLSAPTSAGLFSSRYHAHGCFYWLADPVGEMLALDTRRMEFSIVQAPPGAKHHNSAMVEAAGEADNPGMFVLDHDAFELGYSVRRNNGRSNSGQWQSEKTISLGSRYAIIGSTGRYLLMYLYGTSSLEPGCLTLDAETFQLEKVCSAAKYEHGVPDLRAYVNFPPSLLSPPTVSGGAENKVEETLEQACAVSSNA